MQLIGTQCCSIQEIHNMRGISSGQNGMDKFCRLVFDERRVHYRTRPADDESSIYTHYFFSQPIPDTMGWGISNYCEAFSQFIIENKLGTVISTPAAFNKAFHGDRKAQVWVWTPDQDALRAYWKDRKALLEEEDRKAYEAAGIPYTPKKVVTYIPDDDEEELDPARMADAEEYDDDTGNDKIDPPEIEHDLYAAQWNRDIALYNNGGNVA